MVTNTEVIIEPTQVFDLPLMKILQPTSPELTEDDGLKSGRWYVDIFGLIESPRVVPLQVFRTRRLDTGAGDDYEVLCESLDGNTGIGTPGGNCNTCEFAQWQDNPDGGRAFPPDCGERTLFVFWLLDYDMPVMYAAKGSAMRIANKLAALMRIQPNKPMPLTLGAQMRRTKQYTWFVPTIRIDSSKDALADVDFSGQSFALTAAE